MNIFDDYKNWKDENLNLLKKLKKDDSSILSYIDPVSIVLDLSLIHILTLPTT